VRQIILLLITLQIFSSTQAVAKECVGDTCIGVSANDKDHLVIIVEKGKPGSKSSSPSKTSKPVIKASPKKTTWIPWLPKPKATVIPKPKPSQSAKPKKIAAISLADRVSKMLPSGVILNQPTSAILVREPINFMTTIPKEFHAVIVVLEVPIQIDLKAKYKWDFGDGSKIESALPGSPYPTGTIKHGYSEPGKQKVNLEVSWSGVWRAGAISAPIDGSITQRFSKEIEVYPADTRFTR
jgi:hypothetical protein